MFGLFLMFWMLSYIGVAWYYYNKGIKASGHICKNVDTGVRYTPKILPHLEVFCPECYDVIPAQVMINPLDEGEFPFEAKLDPRDYNIHKELMHNSNASGV